MTRKKFLAIMIIWLILSMAVIGFFNILWEESKPFYAEGDVILFSFGREAVLNEKESAEIRKVLAGSYKVDCCTPQNEFGVQIGEYKFCPAADYCTCMEIYKGNEDLGGYYFSDDSSRDVIWNMLSLHFIDSEQG